MSNVATVPRRRRPKEIGEGKDDLHTGNFFLNENFISTIDNKCISQFACLIVRRNSERNLKFSIQFSSHIHRTFILF